MALYTPLICNSRRRSIYVHWCGRGETSMSLYDQPASHAIWTSKVITDIGNISCTLWSSRESASMPRKMKILGCRAVSRGWEVTIESSRHNRELQPPRWCCAIDVFPWNHVELMFCRNDPRGVIWRSSTRSFSLNTLPPQLCIFTSSTGWEVFQKPKWPSGMIKHFVRTSLKLETEQYEDHGIKWRDLGHLGP